MIIINIRIDKTIEIRCIISPGQVTGAPAAPEMPRARRAARLGRAKRAESPAKEISLFQ